MDELKLPVTVVIPVKNEARNLPLCLARLGRFAKVVVVDSGSTDQTTAIAREHGCDVVNFQWNGHYPKKRNWLLMNDPPTTPWVFFLDADEYLTEAFVDELEQVLPTTTHVGFRVSYANYFLDRELKHGAAMIKLPLFRVGSGLYERIDEEAWSMLDMEVHEHPVLNGSLGQIRAKVDHRDFKGMAAYRARHEAYASWEARRYLKLRQTPDAMANFTKEQRRKYVYLTSWWLAPAYFLYSWVYKCGFLDGRAGFVFARMKSQYFSLIRSKIRDLSRGTPA